MFDRMYCSKVVSNLWVFQKGSQYLFYYSWVSILDLSENKINIYTI